MVFNPGRAEISTMLLFIGLGLYDERDVSVKGLEAIRAADEVYAEFYTSRLMGTSLERLEALYGKSIRVLSRSDVEGEPAWLEDARDRNVAFLVGGDAMVSTTHVDLRLRALEMGIETRVIHGSSIVTAVSGICGLQNYRFGRSTTIPFPYISRKKRIIPQTPYQVLKENLSRDLHTMLFLDIQCDQTERYMTVSEGASLLLEMQSGAGEHILDERLVIGIARAGADDSVVVVDRITSMQNRDLGGPLHILVVPARLHFMEAKALKILAGAPDDLVAEE